MPSIREVLGQRKDTYGQGYNANLLEQYKLYVEMADRISQRRMNANSFYISVNSAITAALAACYSLEGAPAAKQTRLILGFIGLLVSGIWWLTIRSYRQLNSAKFKVIHEIETSLPISPYDAEWEIVGRGNDRRRYLSLTRIEEWVPVIFLVLHLALAVPHLLS